MQVPSMETAEKSGNQLERDDIKEQYEEDHINKWLPQAHNNECTVYELLG
jgi:hypothetical protein